jgi:hypothetical protein
MRPTIGAVIGLQGRGLCLDERPRSAWAFALSHRTPPGAFCLFVGIRQTRVSSTRPQALPADFLQEQTESTEKVFKSLFPLLPPVKMSS